MIWFLLTQATELKVKSEETVNDLTVVTPMHATIINLCLSHMFFLKFIFYEFLHSVTSENHILSYHALLLLSVLFILFPFFLYS